MTTQDTALLPWDILLFSEDDDMDWGDEDTDEDEGLDDEDGEDW